VYAGIDGTFVYGRLDFAGVVPQAEFDIVVNLESWANGEIHARRTLRIDARVQDRKVGVWKVDGHEASSGPSSSINSDNLKLALMRNFEFRLPLSWLLATPIVTVNSPHSSTNQKPLAVPATSRLRLRFSIWMNGLPADALPMEGWIELQLVSEAELAVGM